MNTELELYQTIYNWFDPEEDGVLESFIGNRDPIELSRKIAKTILNWKDVKFRRKLGAGTMGVAWLTSDNNVFKLTLDSDEANNANIIKGSNHPNIFSVLDVVQLGRLPIYAILQEYAGKPLQDPEMIDKIDEIYDKVHTTDQMIKMYSKLNDERFSDIVDGLKWLKSKGISHYDVHSNNVLVKGNNLILIDLGVAESKPSGVKRVSILERKLSVLLNNIKQIGNF